MYQANHNTGEIYIYDALGSSAWGFIDAAVVIADLEKMNGKRVTMRIASPGGSVDEAKAIYNALKRYSGGVDVVVDSAAYSAASYIAMAGERIVMARNAMMMLHSPWTIAMGNSAELRKTADVLDKYGESMTADYAERSGNSVEEMRSILAGETWYTAQEAIDAGFADEIGDIVPDAPTYNASIVGGSSPSDPPRAGTRMQDAINIRKRKAMLGI